MGDMIYNVATRFGFFYSKDHIYASMRGEADLVSRECMNIGKWILICKVIFLTIAT